MKNEGGGWIEAGSHLAGIKLKRIESGDSILLLKLTKLTKPKLMKKNVLQT